MEMAAGMSRRKRKEKIERRGGEEREQEILRLRQSAQSRD